MIQQAKGTKLIIERDLVGSWVMCNNRFTKKKDKKAKRSGVLFQLGDFATNERPPCVFGGVSLEIPGQKDPDKFARDAFTWINIVSRFEGDAEPMKPEHAFALYPGKEGDSEDPCAGLQVPANKKHCLRNRKLHWDQEKVSAIITYWAGMNGFLLEARQIDSEGPGNKFTFTFGDQCRVFVYKEVVESNKRKMKLEKPYEWGEVVSVTVFKKDVRAKETGEVRTKANGRNDGDQQDPPWEPPPPPPDKEELIQEQKKPRRRSSPVTAKGC